MPDNLYALKVKRAIAEDAEEIFKVTKDAFQKYAEATGIGNKVEALFETIDDIKKDIEEKYVLVVKVDHEIAGTIRLEIFDDDTAYLSRLAVAEQHRNTGVAKILMRVVDKIVLEKNIKLLYFDTCSKLTPLVKFYYGLGFYVSSVDYSRGYPRAKMVKEY